MNLDSSTMRLKKLVIRRARIACHPQWNRAGMKILIIFLFRYFKDKQAVPVYLNLKNKKKISQFSLKEN